VTNDEVPDPQNIDLQLAFNGEVRQQSNTRDMIFPVAHIVSYLSQFMTLLPGDVVITGTPQGVGIGMKPPKCLARGDVVTPRISVLGVQQQATF
jgi:2-keto-4-pentenoate hydratase/2-oxohepta-3-ene-1,7-dioic acid hydratase in catechol pathway